MPCEYARRPQVRCRPRHYYRVTGTTRSIAVAEKRLATSPAVCRRVTAVAFPVSTCARLHRVTAWRFASGWTMPVELEVEMRRVKIGKRNETDSPETRGRAALLFAVVLACRLELAAAEAVGRVADARGRRRAGPEARLAARSAVRQARAAVLRGNKHGQPRSLLRKRLLSSSRNDSPEPVERAAVSERRVEACVSVRATTRLVR